jgi:hypothetical protein
MGCLDRFKKRPDGIILANIKDVAGTLTSERCRNFLCSGSAGRRAYNESSGSRQVLSNGSADASTSASHQCDFSFQAH